MLTIRRRRQALLVSLALCVVPAIAGCGTQLRSGENGACAPGLDEWLLQTANEPVMQAPSDANGVARTGTVDCPRLPIIGVVGGGSLVELTTRYSSEESEEQVAVRLKNAAGTSDWSTFEGGGDCLVKTIDSVPSFLTITSGGTAFAITIRRADPSLCFNGATPNPGETPVPL